MGWEGERHGEWARGAYIREFMSQVESAARQATDDQRIDSVAVWQSNMASLGAIDVQLTGSEVKRKNPISPMQVLEL